MQLFRMAKPLQYFQMHYSFVELHRVQLPAVDDITEVILENAKSHMSELELIKRIAASKQRQSNAVKKEHATRRAKGPAPPGPFINKVLHPTRRTLFVK